MRTLWYALAVLAQTAVAIILISWAVRIVISYLKNDWRK